MPDQCQQHQLALDAALCTVRGEGVKTAEVHQAANVTLTTKLTDSKTTSPSTLIWRGRKTGKIGIHLTENGSNQRHVIFDGR